MLTRFIVAAVLVTASMTIALAAPARIIILRHGEKANKWKLCDTGEQRANALAANYLGRGAAKSLFASGDEPAFFFAITLHTLELASPAVASWNKPVILYSVVPEADRDKDTQTKELAAHATSGGQYHDQSGARRQNRGDGVGTQAHRQCQARSKIRGRGRDAA
jgi:hypothetical protein